MTCAAILSLEDFRNTQRCTEIRQRLHDRFDHWLTQLEDRVQDLTPTLAEVTQAVLALRQELTQTVTAGLVEQAHRAAREQRTAGGSQCGPAWSAGGPQERPVETLVGAIRRRRPYVDCERCQVGTAPLDQALRLTERRQQPDVQRAAVQLTKAGPYETACELVAAWTGLPWSAHTAHTVPQAVAAGLTGLAVAPTREEIVAKLAAVAQGQPWRPLLVLAIAGAEGPTRPQTANGRRPGRKKARAKRARWTGAGREAQGVRCSRLAEDRIVQGLSWHPVHTADEAAQALQEGKAAGLIPEEQVRLCVMAAGARWIWKVAQALLPSAVDSLDDDHGREHVQQVAALPYGAHPERQQEWCEAALARLYWGEV